MVERHGIGIVEIVANVVGYINLKKKGSTSWDNELGLVVEYGEWKAVRGMICPLFVVLVYGFLVYAVIAGY